MKTVYLTQADKPRPRNRRLRSGQAVQVLFGLGLFALAAEIVLVVTDSGGVTARNGLAAAASFAAAALVLLVRGQRRSDRFGLSPRLGSEDRG